jgi:hypothetical protein
MMNLSPNTNGVVGVPSEIAHVFIPLTKYSTRMLDRFMNQPHLLEAQRMNGIAAAPKPPKLRPIPQAICPAWYIPFSAPKVSAPC